MEHFTGDKFRGRSTNHTGGRTAVLEEGDFVLYDPSKPLWLNFEEYTQAIVVRPEELGGDVIRFGATVEVRDEEGRQRTYVLVGPDEADPAQGKLSFQSPMGQALMKRRVGDVVIVQRPAGAVEVEILSLKYGS